jgi:hypothetical protein
LVVVAILTQGGGSRAWMRAVAAWRRRTLSHGESQDGKAA